MNKTTEETTKKIEQKFIDNLDMTLDEAIEIWCETGGNNGQPCTYEDYLNDIGPEKLYLEFAKENEMINPKYKIGTIIKARAFGQIISVKIMDWFIEVKRENGVRNEIIYYDTKDINTKLRVYIWETEIIGFAKENGVTV